MEHHQEKHTQDEASITRRDFLKGLFAVIGGYMTFSFAWPFISFLVPSSDKAKGGDFVKVAGFKTVEPNKPTKMFFDHTEQQAFMRRKEIYDIWVVKHSETEATVYSPLCPHLNCHYTWEKEQFFCPCHNSMFSVEGKVLGGPTPRGLDTLPYKIEGGELFVKWQMYKPGISGKAEA